MPETAFVAFGYALSVAGLKTIALLTAVMVARISLALLFFAQL